MTTIVTVLKSGGVYTHRHVVSLQEQAKAQYPVAKFVVLTDQHVPGVEQIRLQYRSWSDWFAKMELFRPDISGDILYFDLDTELRGPLDDMARIGQLTVLRDFYRDGVRKPENGIGSGVMFLPEADRKLVWQRWSENPFKHMSNLRMRGLGDQTFLESVKDDEGNLWIDKAARWQDVLPGQVVSYKVHCNPNWKNGAIGKVPEGARVICAHGRPKPWSAEWRLSN